MDLHNKIEILTAIGYMCLGIKNWKKKEIEKFPNEVCFFIVDF